MLNDQEFKQAVTKIVLNNFGVATAKVFEPNFYSKNRQEIIASLEKLLIEFIGEENAKKQLIDIS